MSQIRNSFGAVLILCLCAAAWGTEHVGGAVFGTWPSGDSVCVDSPINIPAGKHLDVEPGVVILMKTTAPIVISGSMDAVGTEAQPIILIPMPGWAGFEFRPNNDEMQRLEYVVIPADAPEPDQVVVAQGAWLDVDHCSFHAATSCIDISGAMNGGRLTATWNMLRTTRLYSKAVRLINLWNYETDACSNPYGNRFDDNIVKVDVVRTNDPLPPSEDFTSALYIDGSTNLCLERNTFSVLARGSVIGTYFGTVDVGTDQATIEYSDVVVRSYDGTAKGILNAIEGSLLILHCNIEAGIIDDGVDFRPAGILASQTASVTINSSNIVLGQDSAYFVSISGAFLQVDYITRYTTTAHSLSTSPKTEPDVLPAIDRGDPLDNVIYGPHCIYADPRFLRNGTWGDWQTFSDVAAYYGLDSLSPCIDSGDTTWGLDPDNTLPDIGRYYYMRTDDVPEHGFPTVTSVALAPAYPNPFNNSTTIPFTLERAANVRLFAYDVLGRLVSTVEAGSMTPGSHQILFDASGLASGMYIVRLEVGNSKLSQQKIVLLK